MFLDSSPGRTAFVDGREFLFFSGYAYLGMSHVKEFTELVIEGIKRFGLLHPSSRISNTQLALYDEFESKLANTTGFEDSVSFSSGYLAGRAVMELYNGREIYTLPNTHPVLKTKNEKTFQSIDKLVEAINKSSEEEVIIAADSVIPLSATINNFSFLQKINGSKKITCIIDDSHGIGLIAENGKGISSFLHKYDNINFILTYSLSKAYNINGGAVSCSKAIANLLRESPFFAASTAVAPSFVYAFLNAGTLYHLQLKKLQHNIATFIELIKDVPDVSYHPALPMFVLPPHCIGEAFLEQNTIISSFSYPDPTGEKINRVVVNALHTMEDLQKVSLIIKSII